MKHTIGGKFENVTETDLKAIVPRISTAVIKNNQIEGSLPYGPWKMEIFCPNGVPAFLNNLEFK